MAYLDENGLEHFWGKIKDRVSSAVAPKANDADVVHKTGDETVEGVKTFQNTASNTGSATVTALELRNPNISRGDTSRTDGVFTQLLFLDKDGEAQGTHAGRLGLIEAGCREDRATILVSCYKPSSLLADANERVNFLLGYDENGVPFASATSTPLPSVRNGDTDIITRNFIPLDTRIVHTTGNESIAGEKTFTSDAKISKSYPTFSLVSTSGDWSDLYFRVPDAIDQSGFKTLTVLRSETSETGTFQISRRFNGGSNVWSGPSVQLEGNSGDFLLEAQNATQSIALRGDPSGALTWGGSDITGDVHTTGNETIGGNKTFSGEITISKSNSVVNLTNTGTSGTYCDIRLKSSGNNTTTTIRDNYNGNFSIGHTYQGESWGSGAILEFYYGSGNFSLSACAGANGTRRSLIGESGGTLKWNGQTVQTTSDERLKTPLSKVPDAVLDAWEDVNWGQFQYLDAVKEKGESARLHLGLIAQHVMSVFEKHGLDACAYGILCHEEHEAAEDSEAVDLWMVRYAEAQAMEACCVRRENARLKKRIAGLEERLAALEAKLS